MSLLVILGTILTIIAVVLFVLYLASQKKREEKFEDIEVLINRMPHLSGGYAIGIIDKKEEGNDRTYVEFLPQFVNVKKELNRDKNFKIKAYPLYFENNQFKSYANWHKGIKVYVGNPSDPSQLPEEMKIQEPEVIKQIQADHDKKHHIDILKESNKNKEAIQMETITSRIERDAMEQSHELLKNMEFQKVEIQKQEENKK